MNLETIQSYINDCERCIELGGPTPDGYEYINHIGLNLPQTITVTNLSNPITLDPHGDNPRTYPVDEVVDVTTLPYDPNTIDMFLVSSFPRTMRPTLLKNTVVALRPGGLLIFENVLPEDDSLARQCGFNPLLDSETLTNHYIQIYQKA